MPKMGHIGPTIKTLKKRGYFVALATLGYELSAQFFQQWYGFDEVRGTTIEIKQGVITGKGVKIFQEHEKALFLKKLSRNHKIPLAHSAAIGDSRSDREVFKIAGFRIAVNQDGFLNDHLDVEVKGKDLRKVLKHL